MVDGVLSLSRDLIADEDKIRYIYRLKRNDHVTEYRDDWATERSKNADPASFLNALSFLDC